MLIGHRFTIYLLGLVCGAGAISSVLLLEYKVVVFYAAWNRSILSEREEAFVEKEEL